MKMETVVNMVRKLAVPVLMAVLGLVLVVNPDSASALIGKFLGWCCVLGALSCAFGAGKRRSGIVGGILLGAAGVWLLSNPLLLAKLLGRVLGLLLLLQGGRDISLKVRRSGGKLTASPAVILAGLTAALGAVLILLPLTTSRVVIAVIGAVLMVLGIAECVERFRGRKQLGSGGDEIIDVEKL